MMRLAKKQLSACAMLLLVLPVLVLLAGEGAALWLPVLWGFAAAFLAVMAGAFPAKARIAAGIAGLLLLVAVSAALFAHTRQILLPLACAGLYVLVLLRATWPPFREWSTSLLMSGLVLHATCMIAARLLYRLDIWPLQVALLSAYIPVFLLLTNTAAVEDGASARDGRRPTRRIRTGNLVLSVGIAALVLLVANFRRVQEAFFAAFGWVSGKVMWLIGWLLDHLFAEMPTGNDGGVQGENFAAEMPPGEASMFWVVMEKVLMVIGIATVAVLAVFLASKLVKLAARLARRISARFRGMARQLGEGIQDKTESILDWEEVKDAARLRVRALQRRFVRPPRWQDMDNAARVRWVYAQWLRGHSGIPASQTAREALAGAKEGKAMTEIYERVRYGELSVSGEEAAFMRDAARRGE